eukprot:TRINITY_DN202_c1_g1_i1.p1 TRINITY_DN202_c1_g1~~TRINITY_DN202_c1_g1_i1.p1  ORF type:complete len:1151 (+),score=176.74 TRINITY_DN202_c1_g1_i1:485-3454(+)
MNLPTSTPLTGLSITSRFDLMCLTPAELLKLETWESYFSPKSDQHVAPKRRRPDQHWYADKRCELCDKNEPPGRCMHAHGDMEFLFHPLRYKTIPCRENHAAMWDTNLTEVENLQITRTKAFMCPFYHFEWERDGYYSWRLQWANECWLVRALDESQQLYDVRSRSYAQWETLLKEHSKLDRMACRKWDRRYANLTTKTAWLLQEGIVPCVGTLSWALNRPLDNVRKLIIAACHPSMQIILNRLDRPGSHYITMLGFKGNVRHLSQPGEARAKLINSERDKGVFAKILEYLSRPETAGALQVKLRHVFKNPDKIVPTPCKLIHVGSLVAEVLAAKDFAKPWLDMEMFTEENGDDDSDASDAETEAQHESTEKETPLPIPESDDEAALNTERFTDLKSVEVAAAMETQAELDMKLKVRTQVEILLKAGFKHKTHQLQHHNAAALRSENISVAIFGSSFQGLALREGADTDLAVGVVDPDTGNLTKHGILWERGTTEATVISILGNQYMKKLGRWEDRTTPWGKSLSIVPQARVPIIKYQPDKEMVGCYNPGSDDARSLMVKIEKVPSDDEHEEDEDEPEPYSDIGEHFPPEVSVTVEDHGTFLMLALLCDTEETALSTLTDLSCTDVQYSEILGNGFFEKYKNLEAKRPWVTLKGCVTGTWHLPLVFHNDFDVSVRFTGPRGTQLIREIVMKNPEWQAFLYIVKTWGKEVGAVRSTGKDSMLSSYALLVMAIDFLIRFSKANGLPFSYIDPALLVFKKIDDSGVKAFDFIDRRSKWTGRALKAFYKHYGWDFDYVNSAVIIPSGRIDFHRECYTKRMLQSSDPWEYTKKNEWKWSEEERLRGWQGFLRVSDPLESRTNLTRALDSKKLTKLIKAFQQAYTSIVTFSRTDVDTPIWSSPSNEYSETAPLQGYLSYMVREISCHLVSPAGLNILRRTKTGISVTSGSIDAARGKLGTEGIDLSSVEEGIWAIKARNAKEEEEKEEIQSGLPF